MSGYDPKINSNAYHCGAILAIYEKLQTEVSNVNVGIAQRYYSSAIQTPALVIGRLSSLSQHHLRDLERQKPGLRVNFGRLISSVYSHIEWPIPTVLTLPQQAEFALGYYQMNASMPEYLKSDKNKED